MNVPTTSIQRRHHLLALPSRHRVVFVYRTSHTFNLTHPGGVWNIGPRFTEWILSLRQVIKKNQESIIWFIISWWVFQRQRQHNSHIEEEESQPDNRSLPLAQWKWDMYFHVSVEQLGSHSHWIKLRQPIHEGLYICLTLSQKRQSDATKRTMGQLRPASTAYGRMAPIVLRRYHFRKIIMHANGARDCGRRPVHHTLRREEARAKRQEDNVVHLAQMIPLLI